MRRFCTVVWGPGGRDGMSTTLVMLDAQGGLQDMLFCTHLSGALRRGRDFDASSYQQHIAMDPQKVNGKAIELSEVSLVVSCPYLVCAAHAGHPAWVCLGLILRQCDSAGCVRMQHRGAPSAELMHFIVQGPHLCCMHEPRLPVAWPCRFQ